ncbi:MAG: DUF4422 domain-containing protein [Synergistaceae bacterium]|nr:DUF4422 domain-containing protein [Synergistaceae bacterium]
MNVKVMVCYHRNTPRFRSDVLFPIHVGRALASEEAKAAMADMPGDDTGDNISAKNGSYCELTAIYWAWKNPALLGNPDYIGLCHYRRLLGVSPTLGMYVPGSPILGLRSPIGRGLRTTARLLVRCSVRADALLGTSFAVRKLTNKSTAAIRDACGRYDVVLPTAWRQNISRYDFWKANGIESDLVTTLDVVAERYPDMRQHFETTVYSNSGHYQNVSVMRADLWNEYAAWLFDVLYEVERRIGQDVQKRDAQRRRAYGYIGEYLTDIWLSYKKSSDSSLSVGELPLFFLSGVGGI